MVKFNFFRYQNFRRVFLDSLQLDDTGIALAMVELLQMTVGTTFHYRANEGNIRDSLLNTERTIWLLFFEYLQ